MGDQQLMVGCCFRGGIVLPAMSAAGPGTLQMGRGRDQSVLPGSSECAITPSFNPRESKINGSWGWGWVRKHWVLSQGLC